MYYEVCMIDKYKKSGYYLYFLLLIDKIVLRHLVIFWLHGAEHKLLFCSG